MQIARNKERIHLKGTKLNLNRFNLRRKTNLPGIISHYFKCTQIEDFKPTFDIDHFLHSNKSLSKKYG